MNWLEALIELNPSALGALARNLLERDQNKGFEPSFTQSYPGDYVHLNEEGLVEVIMEVKTQFSYHIDQYAALVKQIESDFTVFKPKQYFVIQFAEFTSAQQAFMFERISKEANEVLQVYDIRWIEKQLDQHPDLAEKHRLVQENEKSTNENDKTPDIAIESLLSRGKQFFAVGHLWGPQQDDQWPRFQKKGIWENGHDDQETETVNKVEKWDILFLKSAFSGVLRIKAVGLVTYNPKDGHNLSVNWYEIDHIDLKGLGAYRSAITKIGDKNVRRILEGIQRVLPSIFLIILQMEEFDGDVKNLPHPLAYYAERYVQVLQSDAYYYERARELLVQLKYYDQPGFLDDPGEALEMLKDQEIDIKSFTRLSEIWTNHRKKKKFPLSSFDQTVKDEAPELLGLFELMLNFLAHVSTKAFRKKEFNPGLNEIAETGLARNEDMFSQVLEYALSHFTIPFHHRNPLIQKVVAYLEDPKSHLNIVSNIHRKQISQYFVGQEIESEDFHQPIIDWFSQFDLSIANEENRTCFYVFVLYDESVKPLWESGGGTGGGNGGGNGTTGGEDLPPDDNPGNNDPETEEAERERIPFHLDQVVDEDKLGRKPVARAFARLIKKDVFTAKLDHSFAVHLQGEWGSGKSSFMNFIHESLNEGKKDWVLVNYNAWQNQHISPPWWTLIDQVYRQVNVNFNFWESRKLWVSENWRRIIKYNGLQKLAVLLLTGLSIVLLVNFGGPLLHFITAKTGVNEPPKGITLEVFSKLFISLASLIGIIFSFSRFLSGPLFMTSSAEAKSFVSRATDPMQRIKRHFSKLVDNIISSKRELIIFIDDIDRCNREFIVELLEGIQTLFKEKRVLFIVAGDKQWITRSFSNTYKEFGPQTSDEVDDRLGELFLEKAFQLSFRMPDVSEKYRQEFWSHIIGESGEPAGQSFEDLAEPQKEQIKERMAQPGVDIASPQFMNTIQEDFNLRTDAVSNLVIEEKIEQDDELKHLLKGFHAYINTNPRAIIRLANHYTMTRSTLIAERKDVPVKHLFRWLVLVDHLPRLRTQLTNTKGLEDLENWISENVQSEAIKETCLTLLNGSVEGFDGPLELEIIGQIEGQ